MARRAWRTYQITVAQNVPTKLLHYSENRTAYELASAGAFYISPDPSVSATNGHLIAAGAVRSFNWVTGHDTEMPVWAVQSASAQDIVITVREDISNVTDEKKELH